MACREEEIEIVIVGGGICGLATALALHRKGITSVVLERSDDLRTTGFAIGVLSNGWRALEQLGVASELRQSAVPIQRVLNVSLGQEDKQESTPLADGEARCVRRSDLVTALAERLPHGTIRFGCQVVSVTSDPSTSYPLIQLNDGSIIKPKILIGCDGAHSAVADFLGLKQPDLFFISAVRGLTCYQNGHGLPIAFLRFRGDNFTMGRLPIDDKLVYWFVAQRGFPLDSHVAKDPELIRKFTLESIKTLPEELIDLVRKSDAENLSLTHLRYRAPWDILLGKFRKGTVMVAGDAMHVMGPFLGQGGSTALEDAVVLARSLARKLHEVDFKVEGRQMKVTQDMIGEAMDEFMKERKMRLLKLSLQTYLMGSLLQSSSMFVKITILGLMKILFKDPIAHTRYDCGEL